MAEVSPMELAERHCAAEPIHRLGRVQSHGVVLVCDPSTLFVRFCSANSDAVIQHAPHTLLGATLEALGTDLSALAAKAALAPEWPDGAPERTKATLVLQPANRCFEIAAHRWDGQLIVEIQPTSSGGADPDPVPLVDRLSHRLATTNDVTELCALACEEIQRITGYQRVLAYEFDPEWNGVVVAECPRPGESSRYLGLRFPASDIPPQARALYHAVPLRVIADADDGGTSLLALDPGPVPPDLSHALLRSVSPMHLAYLRNMGVKATIAVSLLVDGRLWGLVVAHDDHPRAPPQHVVHALRVACRIMGQLVAARLLELEHQRQQVDNRALLNVIERLALAFAASRGPMQAWDELHDDLRAWFQADGALYVHGGVPRPCADPGADVATALIETLWRRNADTLFETSTLHGAGLVPAGCAVAGLLWVPLPTPGHALLFWRKESVREVFWGGDPDKAMAFGQDGATLGPRRSFERWCEIRRDHSLPWRPIHLEAARRVAAQWQLLVLEADRRHAETTIRRLREEQSLALRETNERYACILETSHEGILTLDGAGVVDYCNQRMLDILGRQDTPLGVPFAEIVADPTDASELLDPTLPHSVVRQRELELRRAPAGRVMCDLALIPLRQDGKQRSGWLVMASDISERMALQNSLVLLNANLEATVAERTAQLVSAKETADEASRSKTEFLANMSHELRSPLHGILGFTRLMIEDGDIAPALRDTYLRKVERNASNLLALVNDLLDSAKMESNRFSIAVARCDLVDIVRNVISEFHADAKASSMVRALLPASAPCDGDAFRLSQALRNLVANAIRFSPTGSRVQVSVERTEGGWTMAVRDRGPGIPSGELESIFERFAQSSATKTGAGGTGLGLHIARGILHGHGGSLRASNRPDGGACFEAFIPAPS